MNPVLYWNAVLLEASRRDFTRGFNNAQQPGPIRTSRAMAIVHIAIHDVVAFRANQPGATWLQKSGAAHGIVPSAGGDREDMIAGAAVTALKALYPNYHGYFDDSLGSVSGPAFTYGASVANAVLAARASDGSNDTIATGQADSLAYGDHRADPYQPGQNRLGLRWGNVTRFTGGAPLPLDPYPGHGTPDFLANPAYRQDFEEVRDHGALGRGARTAEQQRIGVYWGYDGAMNLGVPPRLYNQVARRIVEGRVLSVPKTAELFAILNVAMADAGIDAWHHKYVNNLWRPVVGIRQEPATDGGDPFWAPLGAPQTNTGVRSPHTPNFPAYPSGHATFGAALLQSLRLSLKTAQGPISVADVLAFDTPGAPAVPGETFSFVSDELDGISGDPDGSTRTRVEKQFRSYAEAVWENAVSRVYLGVHWRFDGLPRDAADNIGGVPLGLKVGQQAHAMFNTGPSLAGVD